MISGVDTMSDQTAHAYRETLQQHPEALKALPDTTRDRYLAGHWPRVVQWLLQHPDLLRDLAKIAEKKPRSPS